MRILHICNDYCGSKVHARLYSEFDLLGAEQTVYSHFDSRREVGANGINSDRVRIVYDQILKPWHHYLFHLRVAQVYASMCRQIDASQFDLIHAATLFSDGALALKLHQRYGIPYVVAVRKTDVYRFLKLGPHTWPMGRDILLNAQRIVFISQALQNAFVCHPMIDRLLPRIQSKFVLQPNGVEDYWIDNAVEASDVRQCNGLVYVGKFDANKNVMRLMEAVRLLSQRVPDVHLDLVGGSGNLHNKVVALTQKEPFRFTYHGPIHDRPMLREVFARNAVFCMPSINETFGLVYVEALSQGLPVLCSRGQGIDGLFAGPVGEFVDPLSVEAIAEGLHKLLTHREQYRQSIDFEQFRWSKIASRYWQMFEQVIAEGGVK